MLRVAICDDNNVFVNKMSQAVKSEFTRQNNEDIELETYVSSELMFQHHLIKPFDVIFLDIDMPELDGFQLAAKISWAVSSVTKESSRRENVEETVEEEDDLELVAVIAAAIAASEGTDPNGLVVRSIKRVGKTNNWKRA